MRVTIADGEEPEIYGIYQQGLLQTYPKRGFGTVKFVYAQKVMNIIPEQQKLCISDSGRPGFTNIPRTAKKLNWNG